MQGDDEVRELAVIEPSGGDMPSVLLGETTTRSSLVRSMLRNMIIAGKFKPGDTLVERHLATMLGVSKTPVREALISLASTGLVRVSHNRGVIVRRPSFDDMWKVFETRLLLEPWAIGRATARGSAQTYPDAAAALHESKALLDTADQKRLSLTNRRFHRALYSQAGNELVIAQLDQMQDLLSLGFVVVWERTVWPVWREEYDEHCEILAAVGAGDADTATSRARQHIEKSMALFEQYWDTGA